MIQLAPMWGFWPGGYSLPSPVAYKYFRMTFNSVRDGTTTGQVATFDFQILDSGGTNILTGGTESATSTAPGSPVSNAFDGNTATAHRNALSVFPFSVQYELLTAATPATLKGFFSNVGAWDLDGSNDGSTWDRLASEPTAGWWNNEFGAPSNAYYHPIIAAECWRVRIASVTGGGQQFQIYEWALRDNLGNQLLTGGYPYASSTNGQDFNRFIDGNTATNFGQYTFNGNTVASGTAYIAYILPQSTAINPYDMQISSIGSAGGPTLMYLDKSPDGGVTWFAVKTISTTWSGGVVTTQTFTL